MVSLSPAEYYTLFVIATALILIISNRLAPDVVALMVLLALGLSGVITIEDTLAGFSRPAVITIMGLFIITATLERTGAVEWLSGRLAYLSGRTERRMIMVFMAAGSLLSLVMNNIAAGAVLLPAAVRVAMQAGIRPSKVLMPLAFGTLIGGMATYFTTANIILSSALQSQGQRALTMLDFLPSGGAMVLAGTLYMMFVGRRVLPERESLLRAATEPEPDLSAAYQLDERLWEVRVEPSSALAGRTLSASRIGERLGVTVMAIWHGGEAKITPSPREKIEADDILLVLGREERVLQLEAEGMVIGRNGQRTRTLDDRAVEMAEVIIGPRSPVVGQTLRDLRFRDKYGLTTVAIWRGLRSYRTDVGIMPLQAGDALLMIGPHDRVVALARERGFILPREPAPPQLNPRKGALTVIITTLVVVLAALGIVATPEATLCGVLALVLSGCIRMEEAYRAVEWRVVFLIAGMLPIGAALIRTGLAERIGDVFTTTLNPLGPLALIAGLYIFTMLLTQIIGGQVAALIVGPIAVTAAIKGGVDPPAVAVAVAMACSASFLTPIAHPVNLLMVTPGGYTFGDFVRVGSGMALVCFLTLLLVMPLFWPL